MLYSTPSSEDVNSNGHMIPWYFLATVFIGNLPLPIYLTVAEVGALIVGCKVSWKLFSEAQLNIQPSVLSKTMWLIPYILSFSFPGTGLWQALQSSVWHVCCRKISFQIQTAKQAPIIPIVHTCWTVFPELLPSYLQVCLTQVNSLFLVIVSSLWSEPCANTAQSFLSVILTAIIDKHA